MYVNENYENLPIYSFKGPNAGGTIKNLDHVTNEKGFVVADKKRLPESARYYAKDLFEIGHTLEEDEKFDEKIQI